MRIAMLSWESLYSVAVGGVAAHVSELSAALVRKGHEVHVLTRRAPAQRGHDLLDGVHYHRFAYPAHTEFVDDINNMCRTFVDRFCDLEDFVGHFDLVHAHDWLTTNAMIWIKKGRGHKCLLTIHSTEYGRCGNTFPNGRSQRVRDQERAGTYWADHVVAVSQATKNEIKWMYEVPDSKATVVYNGVSPQRFEVETDVGADRLRLDIGPLDPTVLFCGRLAHQKGPDLLIEAIPAVLKAQPRAKFVFAGDGEMRVQLENRARQLGVAHATRFLGYRDGPELIKLFKMCDTVCVPSRNEPFGIVVLEAWASGKPVVVTQNGGPNEYVWHEVNGLKIFARADSVAWGINAMFQDFDRARWLGQNGREAAVTAFHWDTIAEQTLSVYRAVCPEALPAAAVQVEAEMEAAAAEVESLPVAEPAVEAMPVAAEVAGEPAEAAAPMVNVIADLTVKPLAGGAAVDVQELLVAAGIVAEADRGHARLAGDWNAVLAALTRCREVVGQGVVVECALSIQPSDAPVAAVPQVAEPAAAETQVIVLDEAIAAATHAARNAARSKRVGARFGKKAARLVQAVVSGTPLASASC